MQVVGWGALALTVMAGVGAKFDAELLWNHGGKPDHRVATTEGRSTPQRKCLTP